MRFTPNLLALGLFLVFLYLAKQSRGESSTCLTVYKEGGAPAVFQSPKCPRWKLPKGYSRARADTVYSADGRCQTAAIQGRRKFQEDRTLCALDLRIPFPGKTGIKEVIVGIVAVFDGHNGAEASEMASNLLLDYFALHTYFLLDATYSVLLEKPAGRLPNKGESDVFLHELNLDEAAGQHELNTDRFKFSLPAIFDDSFHLDILKEALLRAIQDIDATFSKEAARRKLASGSTATVALIADGHILVANIGDSKTLMCSEEFQSPEEARATLVRLYREQRRKRGYPPSRLTDFKLTNSDRPEHFTVKELTKDHHPSRDEERVRVEAAGGQVLDWGGVPRVNGQLAVSRAIGDVPFKSYGVISAPEVTGWHPLTTNDSYLVAASDGVFEKLSLQDVCDLLWGASNHVNSGMEFSSSCSFSLADCLVNTAFEKGSMDNAAAVVLPLHSTLSFLSHLNKERRSGDSDNYASGLHRNTYALSPNINSKLVDSKHAHPVMTKFNRLLVEGQRSEFSCFYMSENLNDDVDDDALETHKDDLEHYVNELQALPASTGSYSGGSRNLYGDQNICLHFGMSTSENEEQCINPESFARFLGLLESIPFHEFGSNNGSNNFPLPNSRYLLKKKFGRGSYGEVWLALHWNCYQGNNGSSGGMENKNTSEDGVHINHSTNQSASNASSDDGDPVFSDKMFILKRIMVERGPSVYLSGLREKHFGELFLKASNRLGGFRSTQSSSSIFKDLDLESYGEGLNHIARYVESFESRSNDIWLVFRHEGVSLSKLIYTAEEVEDSTNDEKVEEARHIQILRPSKWWNWLKTTDAGKEEMRKIIWQLLLALKSCHDHNITHRDIKPENMVMCIEDQKTGRCLKRVSSGDKNFSTKMRIIDFGSALDEFTIKHLYGSTGPSRAEQTHEYAPPEAILNSTWYKGPTSMTLKYDMWSVGVVMLEMILGSPNVFEISSITRTLLDRHLEGWSENLKDLAYKLRSFMELCILIPGSHGTAKQGILSPASWKCSEEFFSHQIKSRDPLKIGFPNIWALRLVRRLLLWHPEDRPSIDEALRHPYFQTPTGSDPKKTGV